MTAPSPNMHAFPPTLDLRTQTRPDSLGLRNAMGMFATGVTVITTRCADGTLAGFTANSFSSVSLDPPLILWSLGLHAPSLHAFEACSHFAINVLSASQAELSQRFATSGIDKFAGLEWREGLGGAPLIADCLATFECAREACHPGGDHKIFVGRVERLARQDGEPLVFFGGRYRTLG